jgi:hypothetical protein
MNRIILNVTGLHSAWRSSQCLPRRNQGLDRA